MISENDYDREETANLIDDLWEDPFDGRRKIGVIKRNSNEIYRILTENESNVAGADQLKNESSSDLTRRKIGQSLSALSKISGSGIDTWADSTNAPNKYQFEGVNNNIGEILYQIEGYYRTAKT